MTIQDADRIVAAVAALGGPFAVRVGGADTYDDEGVVDPQWFPAAELADPRSSAALEMVALHAASRGLPVGRHAASLAFQRYCHRLCGVAVAAWVLHGVGLDLSAGVVSIRFVDATPDLVQLDRAEAVGDAGPGDVLAGVYDPHLLPVARSISAVTGPGLGNLRGNIAAGFAGALRTLSRRGEPGVGPRGLRERAETLLGAREELARGGAFRLLDCACGPRLEYDRKTCCHWYAAEGGRFCSWCSRLGHDERTCRFLEAARS